MKTAANILKTQTGKNILTIYHIFFMARVKTEQSTQPEQPAARFAAKKWRQKWH